MIRDDGAVAAREAWERAFRLAGEALAELGLKECFDYYMPRVFRHGGRWWRIVGPYYIAEEDENGEILAVFTSGGEPREFRLVAGSRYADLQVGNGRYPIED